MNALICSFILRRGSWLAGGVLLLALLLLPAGGAAQLVNGRLVTSFYTWEKFDTVGASSPFTRMFQSAILDVAGSTFSLHTHVQGALTLSDNTPGLNLVRVYYLYGQAKDLGGVADVSLGRLPFFAGVGMGTLDGGLASVRIAQNRLKLTLYGGANVPDDVTLKGWGNISKNFTVGGQAVVAAVENLRASISYINRWRASQPYWTIRPDLFSEPTQMYVVPDAEREQYAGADVSYRYRDASIYGRYDYDMNMKKTQRAQVGLRYTMMEQRLVATADFIHRSPRIPFNSFFANFSLVNLTEYEAGVDYFVTPVVRAFVRGAYIMYPGVTLWRTEGATRLSTVYADDHSFRYTVGAAMRDNLGLTVRGSTGYAGELNTVTLQGAVPLLDAKVVPSAALSITSYRLDKADSRHSALSAVLGTTLRPSKEFSVDLQGQWLNNYIVKSDFRVFARLNVWFSDHMNIFE